MRTPITLFLLSAIVSPALALTPEEVTTLVKTIDERQRSPGDFKGSCYIESKRKDKSDLIFESVVYRRDEQEKFLFLVLKPSTDLGKGWLRVDKNLFLYEPAAGKWERRTERERIGGTDSRRADFDESRLAEEYVTKWVNEEALGKRSCNHFKLEAKAGVDVAYPVIELWVDKETGNVMKRLEFALSGKLMRRALYPEWEKLWSESKKADVYFPKKIFIFDEIEKGNSTQVVIQKVDLNPLDANIFTKAWLESKSR